jgi:hypothetical protein
MYSRINTVLYIRSNGRIHSTLLRYILLCSALLCYTIPHLALLCCVMCNRVCTCIPVLFTLHTAVFNSTPLAANPTFILCTLPLSYTLSYDQVKKVRGAGVAWRVWWGQRRMSMNRWMLQLHYKRTRTMPTVLIKVWIETDSTTSSLFVPPHFPSRSARLISSISLYLILL